VKRAFATGMLALILLNSLGYYGIFVGIKVKNTREVQGSFDREDYSGNEALTFAVPLTVPYYTSPTAEYERVDGEFERNGEVYRLVKQKLYRDTLYVVCVKDDQEKKINQDMTDYVKTFSDKPTDSKHQSNKLFQCFSKEFVQTLIKVQSGNTGWDHLISFKISTDRFIDQNAFEIFSPPRILSFS
jgi:hypothetical protein